MVTTGAKGGTSAENFYHKLEFEPLRKEDGKGDCAAYSFFLEINV